MNRAVPVALALSCLLSPIAFAEEPTAEEKAVLKEQAEKAGLSDAMVAKLSADQIHDILRRQPSPPEPPAVATVAVIGFFAACIFAVGAVLLAIYRVYRQRHDTLRLMVEKGVAIPPELLSPPRSPASDLRKGLVLTMGGLGLGIFLFAVAELRGMWTLGLVPLLVGLGYLVTWRLVGRNEAPPSSTQRPVAS